MGQPRMLVWTLEQRAPAVTHYIGHKMKASTRPYDSCLCCWVLCQNKVITGLYHLGKAFGDGGDINGSCIDKDNHFRGVIV